ncbi:hypothetical protein SUGI_0337380 [Cryptomeria japonica]|nr:hypothetical protein SUGI_0337380 [Cryptomeria japonica]
MLQEKPIRQLVAVVDNGGRCDKGKFGKEATLLAIEITAHNRDTSEFLSPADERNNFSFNSKDEDRGLGQYDFSERKFEAGEKAVNVEVAEGMVFVRMEGSQNGDVVEAVRCSLTLADGMLFDRTVTNSIDIDSNLLAKRVQINRENARCFPIKEEILVEEEIMDHHTATNTLGKRFGSSSNKSVMSAKNILTDLAKQNSPLTTPLGGRFCESIITSSTDIRHLSKEGAKHMPLLMPAGSHVASDCIHTVDYLSLVEHADTVTLHMELSAAIIVEDPGGICTSVFERVKLYFDDVLWTALEAHFQNDGFEQVREPSADSAVDLPDRLEEDQWTQLPGYWQEVMFQRIDDYLHVKLQEKEETTDVFTKWQHKDGLKKLQEQLMGNLHLRKDSIFNAPDEGRSVEAQVSVLKRILVVLDDVVASKQLETLIGGNWLVLNQMQNDLTAIGGMPRPLEIVGGFLSDKMGNSECWKEALNTPQSICHQKKFNELRPSYDKLSFQEKIIFLDIACCYIGKETELGSAYGYQKS